jgi:thiol-disulfide isomerase/thioredoxin
MRLLRKAAPFLLWGLLGLLLGLGYLAWQRWPQEVSAAPPTASVLDPAEAARVRFGVSPVAEAVPALDFKDGEGNPVALTDFRGKVVLLNIWATWCAPCREEMPALDRLQAELGGPEMDVVALSIDQSGVEAVKGFYKEIGLEHLGIYIDKTGQAGAKLVAIGIPTTLLIDREGRELGRRVGAAEWDSPEMVSFLRDVIEKTRDQQ